MRFAARRARVSVLSLLGLAAVALLTAGDSGEAPVRAGPRAGRAAAQQPDTATAPTAPPNVVRQGFPAAGADPDDLTKNETAWEVEWELTHPTNRPYLPPGS